MCCGSSETDDGPEVERPQGDKPSSIPTVPVIPPASGGGKPPMNLTGGDPLPGPSTFPVLPPGTAVNPNSRKRIRRLYCKTGYDLAVFPNGKVQGVKSPRNKYGKGLKNTLKSQEFNSKTVQMSQQI